MGIDRTGTTRIAITFGRYCLKIPNVMDGWRLFLHGLLSNMQEALFATTKDERLCPVLLSCPGGFFLMTRRARVMTRDEYMEFDADMFCRSGDLIIPAEYKHNSFGWLDGKVVAIDYG